MTPAGEVVVELRGLRKEYGGLRPLRLEQLELREGRSVALLGFDQTTAEVLVNLITGASVPDAGEVKVFGRATTAVADADDWLRTLDDFGILTDRVVLLEQFTVQQNLAIPFSLDLDDIDAAHRLQVSRLADEVGIQSAELPRPTSSLSAGGRLRVRLGRALALNPRVLLAEHPSASLSFAEGSVFAADLSRIVAARELTTLVLTADRTFADAVAEEVLTLQPATGELRAPTGWRRWFT
jgi:ABC-type lipoprotein export system ATPase subunit